MHSLLYYNQVEGIFKFLLLLKDKLENTTRYLLSIDASLNLIFSNDILEIENLGAICIDDDVDIRPAELLQLIRWSKL
jgi:hypothetical protein